MSLPSSLYKRAFFQIMLNSRSKASQVLRSVFHVGGFLPCTPLTLFCTPFRETGFLIV